MNLPIGFNKTASDFLNIILKRHPEWKGSISLYKSNHPNDKTDVGSLWLEVSSVTTLVQANEALITQGEKEQLFTWKDSEVTDALIEVANWIDKWLENNKH